ncbi:hypothetical protein D3C78_316400 [compost metagenome]
MIGWYRPEAADEVVGAWLAGGQVVLYFLAAQVQALAAHDATILMGVAQLALVQQLQAVTGLLALHPVGECGGGGDLHAQGRTGRLPKASRRVERV